MPTRDQRLDAEIERDVRGAYATITTAEKNRRSPAGVLQRIGKLFVRWDKDFERSNRRAANAVNQLCGVPLSLQHSHESLARSLREAIGAALREQAEGEIFGLREMMDNEKPSAKGADALDAYELHQKARAVISRSIRTDADEADVAHVREVARKEAKLAGESDDEDDSDRPRSYLDREEA